MQAIEAKHPGKTTWSALRKEANRMGIPAWKLAEDLAFHDLNERPSLKSRVKIPSQDC